MYDKIFAGSCLSGLGIVVKKPSSIPGQANTSIPGQANIFLNRLSLSKDKIYFFITSPYPRVFSEKI
jgi:hypothetical protein